MKSWRNERTALLAENLGQLSLEGRLKFICHLIPATAFAGGDHASVHQAIHLLPYIGKSRASEPHYNFDGVLYVNPTPESIHSAFRQTAIGERPTYEYNGYSQFFRNGCLETVVARGELDAQFVPDKEWEALLISFVNSGSQFFKELGVPTPWYACFALTGIMGGMMHSAQLGQYHQGYRRSEYFRFDRDVILLPEVEIGTDSPNEAEILTLIAPAVNVAWQSVGTAASPNLAQWETFGR